MLRNTGVELGDNHTQCIHLSTPLDNFKHHQSLARAQHDLQSEMITLKSTTSKNVESISDTQTSIAQLELLSKEAKEALSNKIAELQTQLDNFRKRTSREAGAQSVDNSLATRLKHLEVQDANNQLIIKNQKKEIADLKAELQAFRREYHQQMHRTGHTFGALRHSTGSRDHQGTAKVNILYARFLNDLGDNLGACMFCVHYIFRHQTQNYV